MSLKEDVARMRKAQEKFIRKAIEAGVMPEVGPDSILKKGAAETAGNPE